MSEEELTRKEQQAIRKLVELAESWPKTLWLFVNGQSVCVVKLGEDGKRAMTPKATYDPDYIVESVQIPCDGGDW